jgi:WD40 repeat protein
MEKSIIINTEIDQISTKISSSPDQSQSCINFFSLKRNIIKLIFDYLKDDQISLLKELNNRRIYHILMSEYYNKTKFYSEATDLKLSFVYTDDYLISLNPYKLAVYYDNRNELVLAYLNINGEMIINNLILNETIHKLKFDKNPSSLYHIRHKDNDLLSVILEKRTIIVLNTSDDYKKEVEIICNYNITSFLMFNHEVENTMYYIVSGCFSEIYDIKGVLVKIIGKSKKNDVLFSDIFFHSGKKDYIFISLNVDCIILFSFNDCSIISMLLGELNTLRYSCLTYIYEDEFYLVESSYKGILTFWDIERNYIMDQIKLKFSNFVSMIKWNMDMFLVSNFCALDIVSISKREVLRTINNCHSGQIVSLYKILHPSLWEVLFTGADDGTIKLWSVGI